MIKIKQVSEHSRLLVFNDMSTGKQLTDILKVYSASLWGRGSVNIQQQSCEHVNIGEN
jgi:hypothetical protein